MNKTIFGNTESAIVLAEILEEKQEFKKKISANLNEYNQVLNEIVRSDLSKKLKKNFLKVTLERFRRKMDRFDGDVRTFSLNVVTQIYRKHLESL
jgi:hypothetical protein